MNLWFESLLVMLIVADLSLLGASRLKACIRIAAFQGVVLGLLPLFAHVDDLTLPIVAMALIGILLKGAVLPWLLSRALVTAKVQLEIEPYVGYGLSMLAGLLALAGSLWVSAQLPLPKQDLSPLLVPVALSTMFTGLFLIVTRKKALTQVLGYLVLENGIHAFGVALVQDEPLLVQLGVLLDVFVAIFVMGITLFHINRTFDHIDADRLTTLSDWRVPLGGKKP